MKKKLALLVSLLMLAVFILLTSCGEPKIEINFIVDGEIHATVEANADEAIEIPDDPTKRDIFLPAGTGIRTYGKSL
ncbi:MAG: hypothetical protein IIX96_00765 [Clostridia bacterium]|nr:hypothetical protein [Clostridia bacterium]